MSKKLTLKKPPSQRGNRPRVVGPERADPNDIRYVAHHEAAHAVSAVILRFPLRGVDIKRRLLPHGISMGFTDTGPIEFKEVAGKGEAAAQRVIIQCMTGPLAEMRFNPSLLEEGGHEKDIQDARMTAAVALCASQDKGGGRQEIGPAELDRNRGRINALIESSCAAADDLVDAHWPAIEQVAALLIRRRSLTGDEVAEVVRTAPPGGS